MPVIFKNPRLTDYFLEAAGVTAATPADRIAPIVEPYETGRVIALPGLKFEIDHDFWAALPSEGHPRLKKLSSSPGMDDLEQDPLLDRRLRDARLPDELAGRLKQEILSLYAQVLPVYEALFSGYRFVRRQVVWRLNTIRNENMHLDTYQTDFEEHFARLFINLDCEPRIWMTSWSMDELFERFAPRLPREVLERTPAAELRAQLNAMAFGGRSAVWWDAEPRHVVHFEPGEVWAVDSRQVAHQIFYGRRAVSFDFFVDAASMRKPGRHYLARAEALRGRALAARDEEAPAVSGEGFMVELSGVEPLTS